MDDSVASSGAPSPNRARTAQTGATAFAGRLPDSISALAGGSGSSLAAIEHSARGCRRPHPVIEIGDEEDDAEKGGRERTQWTWR
jgi:hypothetical protein